MTGKVADTTGSAASSSASDMTSFIIKAHVDREPHPSWRLDTGCAFCNIVRNEQPSYKVYESEKIVVILDIMPLRLGHMLVIPKAHYSRMSELPSEYAAAAGEALTKVANALTQAIDNTALNVVCNQEYAQAVPHVHYHVIPAPKFDAPGATSVIADTPTNISEKIPRTMRQMHQMEFESREVLDEEVANALLEKLRARL
ncbi:hypothetical protein AX17_005321 [Amanita inopinata Kibby_2008]|nr:hypothetical protein AX17_005321 [Amanita inopinata Kibby_2008]